jgi:catechol 1,2-dioxygenase
VSAQNCRNHFYAKSLCRLVDEITYKLAAQSATDITAPAILGPFWRHDAPFRENGSNIVHGVKDGEICWMHGRVLNGKTGQPIPNAVIDIWQASTNGLYEQQDENQIEHNLRGKFRTTEQGEYNFYCLRPTPYPIPGDGPAGKLLDLLNRHHMRPAHIHLIVLHDQYEPMTTQIFDKKGEYLEDDAVFAVKDSLVVDFTLLSGNPKATLELSYDIRLVPREGAVAGT